jgi:hypothetical protein
MEVAAPTLTCAPTQRNRHVLPAHPKRPQGEAPRSIRVELRNHRETGDVDGHGLDDTRVQHQPVILRDRYHRDGPRVVPDEIDERIATGGSAKHLGSPSDLVARKAGNPRDVAYSSGRRAVHAGRR